MMYLATVVLGMSRAEFWAATPAEIDAICTQHAVFGGGLETEEEKIKRELASQAKFDAMLMGGK